MTGFDHVATDQAYAHDDGRQEPPEWVALLLDGLTSALRGDQTGDPEDATAQVEEDPPESLYPGPADWVAGWLAPMIVRQPTQEFLWCSQWWDHPEVLTRITGLWETWETARLGGATAINDWLATQLDYHLAVITSPTGPLFRCKPASGDIPGEHHTPAGLGSTPAPTGFFGPAVSRELPASVGLSRPIGAFK